MPEQIFTLEPEQELFVWSPKTGYQFYVARTETGELQIKVNDVLVEIDEEHDIIRRSFAVVQKEIGVFRADLRTTDPLPL